MGQIVRDHEELARRLRGLRDGGKKVVFTNGCFDLLHVGHIRCLQDAARRGDFLVVALNSDASIRKLKGPERPVQPEDERAELLCALQCVAYVTIFEDETCGPLLRQLRPQIVAKGTDYSLATLPERDVLQEIGADLVLVGDPKDHSTIDLITQIKDGRGASPKTKRKPAKKPTSAVKAAKPAAKPAALKPMATKPIGSKPVVKAAPAMGAAPKLRSKVAPKVAPLVTDKIPAKAANPPAAKKKGNAASEAHA